MATLMTANLPSDDEEDIDFIPDDVDSEGDAQKKQKGKPRRKKRMRGVVSGGEGSEDEEGPAATDEAHKEVPEHKKAEKRAKMDDLWTRLNQQQPAAKPTQAVNLAMLCKPVADIKKGNGDTSWMRQLGLGKKNTGSVKDKSACAAAALAAAKQAASAVAAQQYGMETIEETRRFAGKNVTVKREVQAGSKDAKAAKQNGAPSKGGLDAVLESLTQAKKVTVFDKSQADWKDYKKTDELVEEELETHKRSGATYLEKKEFLGRAEVAEYERDRDRRLASDVRNRGRL